MRIRKVVLTNFRNYAQATLDLGSQRNILIGENAQGKTNFLEAIELLSTGYSDRASQEADLICFGKQDMRVELELENELTGTQDLMALTLKLNDNHAHIGSSKRCSKTLQLNGTSYSTFQKARGRLAIVSFKSRDLNLLRGSPKFRRDWIDHLAVNLKPSFQSVLSQYQKVVSQRNRLLRTIFEKGKLTTTDHDELKVWDEQASQLGAQVIAMRLDVLSKLLPKASEYQSFISQNQETLTAIYERKVKENPESDEDDTRSLDNASTQSSTSIAVGAEADHTIRTKELKEHIAASLKARRHEEIVRKQTLTGPHRDDIAFYLDEFDASHFGSQGQQRSLVLALKLAELELVCEVRSEYPVLLLDDVLAELDLQRQALLMSLVGEGVQTLITTTDLSGFRPEWLTGARFFRVQQGSVSREETRVH